MLFTVFLRFIILLTDYFIQIEVFNRHPNQILNYERNRLLSLFVNLNTCTYVNNVDINFISHTNYLSQ